MCEVVRLGFPCTGNPTIHLVHMYAMSGDDLEIKSLQVRPVRMMIQNNFSSLSCYSLVTDFVASVFPLPCIAKP